MLDPKFIKDNLAAVAEAAKNKKMGFDDKLFLRLYEARLTAIEAAEQLRRDRNAGSDEVKNCKDNAKRTELIAQMKSLGEKLSIAENALREAESGLEQFLLTVPSIPSQDTPIGNSDADNVFWRSWGQPPQFDFASKDHITLGQELGLIDFERGIKVAGSRSYFLTGWGALIERAIHSLCIQLLASRGFQYMSIPVLVRTDAMQGTGYLPGGKDQAYHFEKDDLWLVGTSEVSLASYFSNEVVDLSKGPIRVASHSSCFRREAGAHGKDTKGLYRVHQFQKIEQVVICEPNEAASDAIHMEILKNAEDILQALELPYRVVKVCTGDLGQGQVKKHDIEAWMPSRGTGGDWGETHSCSSFNDFQARRLKIKCKDASGKPQFAFTLNNTAIATPRVLISLFEVHQTKEGRIRIPKALQPFLNGLEMI
jgi:seryl-tRNA synthetase